MAYTSSVLPHQRKVDTVQVTHVDYPDDPFIINKAVYLANQDDYKLVGEKQDDSTPDDNSSDGNPDGESTDSNQENPDSEPKQRKTRTRKTSKPA